MARIGYKFMVLAAMTAAPGVWAQANLYNNNTPVGTNITVANPAMSLAVQNGFNPAAMSQMNLGQSLGMSLAQQMMSGSFNPQALFSTLLQGAVSQMMPGASLTGTSIPGMTTGMPPGMTAPGMTMPGAPTSPGSMMSGFIGQLIQQVLTGGMQGGTPSQAANIGGVPGTMNPMTGQFTPTASTNSPYSSGLSNSTSSNNFGGYSNTGTGSSTSTSGDTNENATRAQKLNAASGEKKVAAVYDATYNAEPDTDFKKSSSQWDAAYAAAYAQYDVKNSDEPTEAFKLSSGKWDATYAKTYAQADAKKTSGPNEAFKSSDGKWDASYLAAYKAALSPTKRAAFETELKAEEASSAT